MWPRLGVLNTNHAKCFPCPAVEAHPQQPWGAFPVQLTVGWAAFCLLSRLTVTMTTLSPPHPSLLLHSFLPLCLLLLHRLPPITPPAQKPFFPTGALQGLTLHNRLTECFHFSSVLDIIRGTVPPLPHFSLSVSYCTNPELLPSCS